MRANKKIRNLVKTMQLRSAMTKLQVLALLSGLLIRSNATNGNSKNKIRV